MKKFVTSLIALTLISQPVQAREYRRERHHDNTGAVVAGVLGGIILGAVITESSRERRDDRYDRDDRRVPYDQYRRMREIDDYNRYWTDPRRRCFDVTRYDYYGNPYYDRVCQ